VGIGILVGVFLTGLFFVFAAVSVVLNGWVLNTLWGWFMVPVLGLPQISIAQAMGIAAIVRLLTYQYTREVVEEGDEVAALTKEFIIVILQPFVVLLLGWIIHFFV